MPALMEPRELSIGLKGKRIIVQGLGNVGFYCSKFFREKGDAIITAIAEYEGGIYNENGLNEEEVFHHRRSTGSILNFPGATNFKNSKDVLELDCDILIPAGVASSPNETTLSSHILV